MAILRSWIGLGLLLGLAALVSGCRSPQAPDAACVECHQGLEQVSPTHGDCLSCHGGDGANRDKEQSHRGMFGGKNPADPSVWEKTCGRCHAYQLGRVKSNLMHTNTGMIKNIQLTWEGEDGRLYAAAGDGAFAADGTPLELQPVTRLDNLAGELYRKFCSLCHVGGETNQIWSGSHGAGCSACHFPYNDNGTYQGGDPTMQGKWSHSASHRLQPLPDNQVCARCHNRSGRIALSYQGLNDGNNGLVPTREGMPGPTLIGGVRNVTAIVPDIHFEKGMDCIDCHTSREVMGDGYAYENLYLQTEIRCEDCHGSATEPPRHAPVVRENEEPVRESRSYQRQVVMGDELVLTAKGRKYANVFVEDGKIWVVDKRDGQRHESKVISGTPEHLIAGHERMECYSCHSASVAQCYGCHTEYDRSRMGRDFILKRDTPGAFSETEDVRTLYPFPLALNQRGRISTVTPGCQTFVTVKGRSGQAEQEEYVARYQGKQQLRFAPFYSHNTGKKAVGCGECHANPAFLGFGQHVLAGGDLTATLLCEKSPDKPLDGFVTLSEGRVKAFSAITREDSRPLNGAEVRRVWAVNQCLVCHADPKDPIYRKELDYRVLDRCLDRAARRP